MNRKRSLDYLYINVILRFLAKPLVIVLSRTAITPNMISNTGIMIALIASLIIAFAKLEYSIYALPIFFLISIFSVLDGDLARRKNMISIYGGWLGLISERCIYMMIGTAFAWYGFRVSGDPIIMLLCFVSLLLRESIGILRSVTLVSYPKSDDEIFSMHYKNKGVVSYLKRIFTYGGNMYILILMIGIYFEAHQSWIIFMVFYGFISFSAAVIIIGKRLHSLNK